MLGTAAHETTGRAAIGDSGDNAILDLRVIGGENQLGGEQRGFRILLLLHL